MSRNVTLSQLRTDIAAQCDFSTSSTGRYTPTLLNRIINQSIQRFRERVSNEGMTHFLVPASGTLPPNPTSTYAFQTLDLSTLSPSLVRTYGVDISIGGVVRSLAHRPFTERNEYTLGPTMTGTPIAWAHFQTRSLAIMPAPDASYPYTVWYLPVLADLSADGDTFDGVAGWEVWVLWDCVCQLIARDQYVTAYQQAVSERDLAWQDIVRSSTKVSAAGGAFVGRDSMGQAGLFGRGARREVAASIGSTLPPNSSVTNEMLVQRTGPIVLGRLSPLTGNVEDTPVASLIPYILGTTTEPGTRLESNVSAPWVWQQRRGWVTPDIDLTGATDATAAINTALQTVPVGGCVFIPYGRVKVAGKILVARTRTLCSYERGMQFGPRVYSPGETQGGAQLEIPSSNAADSPIELEQSANLRNFVIWYPSQATNAAPDSYDYTIDIPENAHGTTVENICAINPYKLLRIDANGCRLEAITGWPLAEGINMLEVRDVMRVNAHFVSTVNFEVGATLAAWVRANGKAFIVNFAEQFSFHESFAHGYRVGLWFTDEAAAGPGRTYGEWKGGGFDACVDCVSVNGTTCLSSTGLAISDATLIPSVASNDGHAFIWYDNMGIAGGEHERPCIYASNVRIHGSGMDRAAWLTSTSFGRLLISNSNAKDASADYFRNDSLNALLCIKNVTVPSSGTRLGGVGPIIDEYPA